MIFSSYEFIFFFLPLSLGSFLALRRMRFLRTAMFCTTLFSLGFYTWWNPVYVLLLVALMVANYALGRMLVSSVRKRAILTVGICLNLGVLGYFKYTNFLLNSLEWALGWSYSIHEIILPLAISFFTFQKIAFLVDVYQGKVTRLNFLDFCLFVCFFPQLIAGPIVHYREMQPQFEDLKAGRYDTSGFVPGLTLFLIGLFKKVVIADSLARVASPIFAAALDGGELSALAAWTGALAYTFQLYFDFSGYSDMAIGIALMFGIRLPFNFDSPYKATSIIDFWRRWHITLSNFLRDYLYIPLGGNRHGDARRLTNLMITMLLGGLWHGAGWTFVAWGGLHGGYLIINHLWRARAGAAGPDEGRHRLALTAASTALTFLAVVVGWVFFRATTFEAALRMLGAMAGIGDMESHFTAESTALLLGLAAIYLLVLVTPNSQQIALGGLLERHHRLVLLALGAASFVTLMLLSAPSEFIYFRF